jgi:adenine phosphoribosyltransferase
MGMHPQDLRSFIRDIPDFPKPGIMFKDITPLLKSPRAFASCIEAMASPFDGRDITAVVAIESRGFIFGSAVARVLNAGFVPIRKPGKLPWTTRKHEYVLEYGSGTLEIHDDALTPDDRVLLVDDVLATGGTAAAAIALIDALDASVVGVSMLMELSFLNGRQLLRDMDVSAVLTY